MKVYISKRPELYHYASPYYDPVKAHEYYEEHKKLKGRRSTASLNEQGKSAAQYIKRQIYAERDKKLEDRKTKYDSDRTSEKDKKAKGNNLWTATKKAMIDKETQKRNQEIESSQARTKSSIEGLQATLKNLSAEDKKGSRGEQIREQIAGLREENKKTKETAREGYKTAVTKWRENTKTQKERISSEYKAAVEKLKTGYSDDKKTIRKEAEDNYLNELDRLKGDSKMLKTSKRKK